jgi:hypothetical protein
MLHAAEYDLGYELLGCLCGPTERSESTMNILLFNCV